MRTGWEGRTILKMQAQAYQTVNSRADLGRGMADRDGHATRLKLTQSDHELHGSIFCNSTVILLASRGSVPKRRQDNSGDQAGSEANEGVGIRRSL